MTNERQQLADIDEELKQLDEQLLLLMSRKQKLLKRKKRIENCLSSPVVVDLQSWDKTDFDWSKKLDQLKTSLFKVNSFRPLQLQAINATMSGHDCIVIMPTGGGKSLCFQLPAFLSKGFTLVVSPLISLMEDQLMSLAHLGIEGASLLNASTTADELKLIQDSMISPTGSLRLLYVTPEKLAKSKRFMSKLEKAYSLGRLSRLVIDEVHCCSQWGHDFRPDYKFLGVMKRQFPTVPILGLTATATQEVVDDVIKMLSIPNSLILRAPLNRANLFYEVYPKCANGEGAIDEIYTMINTRFTNQSGIVYCLSQRDTEEVASELCKRGLKANSYHANIDANSRSRIHADWSSNRLQVVVATIAFGMGIDKPDVRFVIHHSISKSLESYYQESGRAGRDDCLAYCIMYVNFADIYRQSTMVFTEQTGLEKLYAMAGYAFDLTSCRRQLIAQHFSERWTSLDCQQMCDHCKQQCNGETKRTKITSYARSLIAILQNSVLKNQRMTGLKLLDAWLGKGSPALRLSQHIAPSTLSRTEAERVIVHLLLNGFLREDFHFTPYNTISYILPGERAHMLDSDEHDVFMNLFVSSAGKNVKAPVTPGEKKAKIPVATSGGNSTTKKKNKRVIETDSENDSDVEFLSKSSSKRIKHIEVNHENELVCESVVVLDDEDTI